MYGSVASSRVLSITCCSSRMSRQSSMLPMRPDARCYCASGPAIVLKRLGASAWWKPLTRSCEWLAGSGFWVQGSGVQGSVQGSMVQGSVQGSEVPQFRGSPIRIVIDTFALDREPRTLNPEPNPEPLNLEP